MKNDQGTCSYQSSQSVFRQIEFNFSLVFCVAWIIKKKKKGLLTYIHFEYIFKIHEFILREHYYEEVR